MSERVNVQVKVDRDVWERFQSFVIETRGQKYGNLGREAQNALVEYMDHDRLNRVDEKVDEILTRLDSLDGTHTHTPNTTAEWAEWITDELAQLGRTVIPDDEVRRIIERGPGGDDRTVAKYKDHLKRHGLAYEHPSDSCVWTLSRDDWLRWAVDYVNNNPTVTRTDVLEDYPIGHDEIERLATEVPDA